MKTKKLITIIPIILSFLFSPLQAATYNLDQTQTIILTTGYTNNMNEVWNINSTVTDKPLRISYNTSTETNYDFVTIFSVDNAGNATWLITLSGQQSGTITTAIPSGKAKIVFTSDGSVCYGAATYDGLTYNGINNISFSVDNSYFESENMLVNGNIGIGTNNPTRRLDIAALNGEGIRIGKINDRGNYYVPVGGISTQYNIDFTGFRDINPDQVGARIAALRFNCYQENASAVQKTGLAFYTNPSGINTGTTNLVERMRISPEGKVGIGLTDPTNSLSNTPTDELLTVNGVIHAKELKISLDGLADFVFKPSYNLMSLPKLEQFVRANSHLPGIPSATEVDQNGLSVGEMQNKLLQKIEELTLYVIDQQKEINQLKQDLKK